ncbi:MAG: prepilin-type N-terminal cleavage/methylation domain-containing protein [Actinomycetota bacterium]
MGRNSGTKLRTVIEEEGFSLIELLVVIVIVAILAAIAIPAFISQRDRAWRAQSDTTLKNAATAMEAAAVENGGDYSDVTVSDLTDDQGLKYVRRITILTIESANQEGFCLSVLHTQSSDTFYWDSGVGSPSTVNCRANYPA